MPFCKFCGAEIREGAMFCKNCGKPVSQSQSVIEETPEVEVKAPVLPPPPPVAPVPEAAPVPETTPVPETPSSETTLNPEATPVPETPEPSTVSTSSKSSNKKTLILLVVLIPIVLMLLGGIGTAVWFFAFREAEPEYTVIEESSPIDYEESIISTADADETENYAEEYAEEETVETSASSPLSTDAIPTEADFKSWYINSAMKSGKPGNAKTLSGISDVSGSWKVLLYQDPTNKYGVKAYTFATITIDGTDENAQLSLKRHSIRFLTDNTSVSEESEAPDAFSAKWKSGKLIASGVGSMTISSFWEQGGKQYAIGTFDSPDGMPVSLGMVRP